MRLIPPAYVKPFVKRQKNDAADAEAICEAAQRPTMRFVLPKSAETQAAAIVFRTRDLLVRQRTQLINALRDHLAEFGFEDGRTTRPDTRQHLNLRSYPSKTSCFPWGDWIGNARSAAASHFLTITYDAIAIPTLSQ